MMDLRIEPASGTPVIIDLVGDLVPFIQHIDIYR